MSLCKYKDALGIPNEGFHKTRIPGLNIALNDLLGTFLLALILWLVMYVLLKSTFLSTNGWVQYLYCFIFFFILGIILHRIFCVNTTINKLIFGVV